MAFLLTFAVLGLFVVVVETAAHKPPPGPQCSGEALFLVSVVGAAAVVAVLWFLLVLFQG